MDQVAPLTAAQTLRGHAETNPPQVRPNLQTDPPPMPKNAPSQAEHFHLALTRAVVQTAQAGLDTCIVVTHREAIRFVEAHWIPPAADRVKRRASAGAGRTYCCVASYRVQVDLHEGTILQWNSLGGVLPYQLVQPQTFAI